MFPDRFLNCGVAEQNMTGIAAGLALEGYKVFTYSIANFNTFRCIEQIRNDVCYNNLDVTIVSVGGGFSYGNLGYSHHAVQDIGLMALMPNISLLLPGNSMQVKYCTNYSFEFSNPKYLRLGKTGDQLNSELLEKCAVVNTVYRGVNNNTAILSTSNILSVASKVKKKLNKINSDIDLYSVSIIDKNFNEAINRICLKYEYVFTIEEHLDTLGFGSLVQKALELTSIKVITLGLDNSTYKKVGGQNYLRNLSGLDPYTIANKILSYKKKFN